MSKPLYKIQDKISVPFNHYNVCRFKINPLSFLNSPAFDNSVHFVGGRYSDDSTKIDKSLLLG